MSEPLPYSSGNVLQNVRELYAAMDRYREQHGPMLRELRCPWGVRVFLQAVLPKAESAAVPSLVVPTGVPLIDDADVPAGHLRFVYDDDTTRDVVIDLELRGQFIERNTVRAPKRRLVDRMLRRKGASNA